MAKRGTRTRPETGGARGTAGRRGERPERIRAAGARAGGARTRKVPDDARPPHASRASAPSPDADGETEEPGQPAAVLPELVEEDAEGLPDPLFLPLDDERDDPAGGMVESRSDGEERAAIPAEIAPEGAPKGTGALVPLDPLQRYLSEIRRYPPLDRDEETRLARTYRSERNPEAGRRLITSNLILVVKIARLFRRAVANTLDLIQEGNLGLLQALEKYDPEVGVRFSTYAAWWIRAYILKYLLDNVRMVRVGTTNARRKLLYNLQREKRQLEAAGIAPAPRLLAERFGVSEKDVVEIEQSLAGGDVALDAPAHEEGSQTRGDSIPAQGPSVEDEVARRELKELLDEKIRHFREDLDPRETDILDRRLLADEPSTLQEIGDRFGITREAVRQAEKRLTERLRSYLASELGEEAVLQFRARR